VTSDAPRLIPIQSIADPRVADYAGLRDAQLRQLAGDPASPATGVFIAEGELVVRQLLASRLSVRSVLLTRQRLSAMRDAIDRLPPYAPVFVAEQEVMNGVVGFNIHRGVLAAGLRPPPPPLDALLASSSALVLLEDLANHDNVGGIFRATAALAGIADPTRSGPPRGASVLLSPRSCDPLYRKAIRVSMGTALLLPFARLDPWPAGLLRLKEAGFTLAALTPDPSAIPIEQVSRTGGARPALLLGAEGPGLSRAALDAADLKVRIPIDPGVDSLNVAVAAAIALQRLCAPPEA
jgi:tRNA G18 (ribose-2'-O)-methylase SpoU